MRRWFPFAFFLACAAVLAAALYLPEPSHDPMRGQAFPAITLTPYAASTPAPDTELRIVNFFASWCTPCIAELPYLTQLSEQSGAQLIGIAWQDKPDKLDQWFATHGNPFATTYLDADGAFGISLGLRGLPETYFIAADGRILAHHKGPVVANDIPDLLQLLDNES